VLCCVVLWVAWTLLARQRWTIHVAGGVGELIDAVCVRVLREVKGAGTCRRATAGGGLLIAGFWLAFWKVGWLGQRLLLD